MPHESDRYLALLRAARRRRSAVELTCLNRAIRNWLALREEDRDDDGLAGKHHTRLRALRDVFRGMFRQLRSGLRALPDDAPDGAKLFEGCRAIDGAVLWLRRLWEYYKDKFDQRGDKRVRGLLLAADEVVWSCHRPVAQQLLPDRPAPLCFVESYATFSAVEADKSLPFGLVPEGYVTSLQGFIKTLPVPLLGIPPWCVDAPWWLVNLGHEVGHHIQHECGLVDSFKRALQELAATTLPDDPDAGARWYGWGEEVFADWYAVQTMGGCAGLALSEALWASPARMLKGSGRYPPAVVRLELSARLAERLPSPSPAIPRERRWAARRSAAKADPGLGAEVETAENDLRVVEEVVKAAPPEAATAGGPLHDLLHPIAERLAGGRARWHHWANVLRGGGTLSLYEEPTRVAARQVVCGSLTAWVDLMGQQEDAEWKEAVRTLAERSKHLLQRCAEPGTRAGEDLTESPQSLEARGREQVKQLLMEFGLSPDPFGEA
jgi:hypothetical protein